MKAFFLEFQNHSHNTNLVEKLISQLPIIKNLQFNENGNLSIFLL